LTEKIKKKLIKKLDRPSSIAKLGFGELCTLLIGPHHVFATLPLTSNLAGRWSLVRCSPPGCREEPKRKRQHRLASEGSRTSRGLGEESICCSVCVSMGWLCGLPHVFSILDFGGLLAWTAAYVSAWPTCSTTSCMDWTVTVGVIFIFYQGHSWLENTILAKSSGSADPYELM
jgi:hypothetical protein